MIVWFVDASVLLARKDADDHRQQEAARQLLAGGAMSRPLVGCEAIAAASGRLDPRRLIQ